MGKAKRFNSYDNAVAEKRKLVQSYGQQRQKLSVGSSFRNEALSPPTVTTFGDTGTGDGKFLTVSLSADQTTNLAATDHVEFDTKDEDGGIVLQTGAGQADGIFELESGKKYYLSSHLRPEFSASTGFLVTAWFDITNSAEIGSQAIYGPNNNNTTLSTQPVAAAIVTPAENITVELRIISVGSLTALANEFCSANLFEIALGGTGVGVATGGGGGGGVSFPITPTINDHGNVGTTTEDIDLSLTTAHSHKITLTGNPTLTFSNPPSTGTQIEFEIEFVQDGTGNRTVTHPASVAETVTISPTADSVTIVTYRTNDGGTTYHAVPSLRGSISLSTSNFLPLTGGTLTGNLVMAANIVPDATGTRDIGTSSLYFSDVFTGTLMVGDATDNYSISGNPTGLLIDHSGGNIIFNDGVTNNYTFDSGGLTLAQDVGISIEAPITFTEISQPASTNRHIIYAENTSSLVLNTESTLGASIRFDYDGTDGHDFEEGSFTSTHTSGLTQTFFRDDSTPTNGDTIANLDFQARDSATNAQIYASIAGIAKTVTSSSEAGAIEMSVATTGTGALTKGFTFDNLGLLFEGGFNLDMNGNRIDLDADNDTSIRGNGDDLIQFEIGGLDAFEIGPSGQLKWSLTGVEHTIDGGSTTLTIDLDAATDRFIVEHNNIVVFETQIDSTNNLNKVSVIGDATREANFIIDATADTSPSNGSAFGRVLFKALSSTSTQRDYVDIIGITQDTTDADEDGGLRFDILSAGNQHSILNLTGGLFGDGIPRIGFFGKTGGASPTWTTSNVTTNRTINANTITLADLADVVGTIIEDLENFGLFS